MKWIHLTWSAIEAGMCCVTAPPRKRARLAAPKRTFLSIFSLNQTNYRIMIICRVDSLARNHPTPFETSQFNFKKSNPARSSSINPTSHQTFFKDAKQKTHKSIISNQNSRLITVIEELIKKRETGRNWRQTQLKFGANSSANDWSLKSPYLIWFRFGAWNRSNWTREWRQIQIFSSFFFLFFSFSFSFHLFSPFNAFVVVIGFSNRNESELLNPAAPKPGQVQFRNQLGSVIDPILFASVAEPSSGAKRPTGGRIKGLGSATDEMSGCRTQLRCRGKKPEKNQKRTPNWKDEKPFRSSCTTSRVMNMNLWILIHGKIYFQK